jgi:cytochrome c oxidase subunit 2
MNGADDVILWGAIVPVTAVCLTILILLIRTALRRDMLANPATGASQAESISGTPRILLAIAAIAIISVPLQRLISLTDGPQNADITVEVTGNMWFWTYRYVEAGDYSFSAPMLEDAITGELRLAGLPEDYAAENNRLVVPVGKTVRLVTKGESVIYRWGIPAIGVLVDALPGRPNETLFSASSVGRYYSDYDALCSPSHVFIPIEINVVSEEQFDQWLADKQIRVSVADTDADYR